MGNSLLGQSVVGSGGGGVTPGGGGGGGPTLGEPAEIAAADFEAGASANVEHGLGETPDGIISYFEAITG